MKTHSKKSNAVFPEEHCTAPATGSLSNEILARQNIRFANTRGLSQNNSQSGYMPGYQDIHSGETVVSRFANGEPAPIHILDGLPEEWILSRDDEGRVAKTKPGIIAGFLKDGEFYTREDVVETLAESI